MMTSWKCPRTISSGLGNIYLLVDINNASGFYSAEIRNTINRLQDYGELVNLQDVEKLEGH